MKQCRTVKRKPRLLRIPDAVAYLDNVIKERTMRQWIFHGKIPSVRIGAAVCVPVEALDALIAEGRHPRKSEVAQ
jgi:excisionase family DNA binding protein